VRIPVAPENSGFRPWRSIIHVVNDYHARHECDISPRRVAQNLAERLRVMPAIMVTGAPRSP